MIRFYSQLAGVVVVVVSLVALPGCGSSSPTSKSANKPAAGHYEGDGHDHSKDRGDHKGHDHAKDGDHK